MIVLQRLAHQTDPNCKAFLGEPNHSGAFLIKEPANFDLLKLHANYLNLETNEAFGILDLVVKSVQTTRRFDALKLFVSMQCLGRKTCADMIETTIDTARATAALLKADVSFELATISMINAVVFRYIPQTSHPDLTPLALSNRINSSIRLELMRQGQAICANSTWRFNLSKVYLAKSSDNDRAYKKLARRD